ncbi:QueT transporter family protein [Fusibacter bizertensis]|uniref:QueT transporter family protein n=1 Tax=Fusibacter bizertensis TaxID=1488331 RepID=A0ABT6N825_9FIRM|nr:QueT transporter family protein [Fusibacter bizertensis]MDH8676566.1 QueT transporter family protein [Fusibacter bizertensis]
MNRNVNYVVKAGVIAALYVVLVMVFSFSSFGPIQFRIAEALTILPYFTSAAIPGVFVGCLIANIVGGAVIWDIIFGSLATLLAAYLSYKLRKKAWLVTVPPILINTIVVGFLLKLAYGIPDGLLVLMGGVLMGELVSVFGIGMILLNALKPVSKFIVDKE